MSRKMLSQERFDELYIEALRKVNEKREQGCKTELSPKDLGVDKEEYELFLEALDTDARITSALGIN